MERKDTGKGIVQQPTKNKDKIFSFDYKASFLKLKHKNFEPELDSANVKGRLRNKLEFWKQIKANKFIIESISNGYILPFLNKPKSKYQHNNISALKEHSFVSESINELLESGSVVRVPFIPTVVNPLSVASSSSGKKRLILDLRYVNEHLKKEYIKYDDWRNFQHFVRPDAYVFNFDLSKGYHHLDIFPEHQLFLGFAWENNKSIHHYVFTVLPFGLSTAPAIFTKLLRPLVAKLHEEGINISVYIDDGAGIDYSYERAKVASTITRNLVANSGFLANEDKSHWEPSRCMTWLGVRLDLIKNSYHITDTRIDSLLSTINFVLKNPYTSARNLSRITGKVVSTKFILGDIVRLKTRFLYKVIDDQSSWDSRVNILNFNEALKEIIFWRDNITSLNKKYIKNNVELQFSIFSDASDSGIGGFLRERNVSCYKHFQIDEREKSSTWRELEGIRFSLESFSIFIRNSRVVCYTDNMAASHIVKCGSSKEHLHCLALRIYELCKSINCTLTISWIPRHLNTRADAISRFVDADDWETTESFYEFLDKLWGPFTIDRFANFKNAKTKRYNSRFFDPYTEGVDAFMQDWSKENNFWVPPVNQIIQTILKISSHKAQGTLVVPHWPAASFWSLLQSNDKSYASFVSDFMIFKDTSNLLQQGNFSSSLLGSEDYKGGIAVFKIRS